jgi:hypothetical protein
VYTTGGTHPRQQKLQQQRQKCYTLFTATRPRLFRILSHKRHHQVAVRAKRAQGALLLFLALPSISRAHIPPWEELYFFLPPHCRPSPPTVQLLHLRRDHHRSMPSSHVYLSTYIQLDLHARADPLDSPISRAPATSPSAIRTFYNRIDPYHCGILESHSRVSAS